MLALRRTLRRSTWALLAAFVFSSLAMAPLGLHAHTIGASAFHPDFCTSSTGDGSTPSLAATPDKKSPTTKRCNDCAGCAGGAVALASPIAPWLAVAGAADLVVIAQPPAPRQDDLLVARPRGPPVPA